MKSFCKLGGVAGLSMIAAAVMAGTPGFQAVRTIDYQPHDEVGNVMALVTNSTGTSLYFGDWYHDNIMYIASPLTSDGTANDIANTIVATLTPGAWETGGWSYQSGGRDGTTIYLGGASETTTQLFATNDVPGATPNSWTTTQISGITGIYSGPSVVGTNKIVMADYSTGALQFFTISGGVATTDGAPIANPNVGTAKTLSVKYDATSGKIFAYMCADLETRRIDVFNSNGTAAGTTYVGTWAPAVASTLTVVGNSTGSNHNRSAQISIDNEHRILVAPFRDGVSEGWDVFDIATVGATGTPYKQIRSADLNFPLYTGTSHDMTGSAVFTDGTDDYLALGYWNKMTILKLTVAAVSDWALY